MEYVYLETFKHLNHKKKLGWSFLFSFLALATVCSAWFTACSTDLLLPFFHILAEHLRESKCFHQTVMQKSQKKPMQGNAKVKKRVFISLDGNQNNASRHQHHETSTAGGVRLWLIHNMLINM